MGKDKTPKVAPALEKSLGKKVPKAVPGASGYNAYHPALCLSNVVRSSGSDFAFTWDGIDPEVLKRVACKLVDLSSMKWTEILGHQNHGIPVADICKEARDHLEALKLDDYDRVHTFRITGAERVWYIKQDHHAFVLWWDPDHRICPSQK